MADYTVQAGDTLSKIAKAHNLTVEQLAEMNGIKDVNKLQVGQELVFSFEGDPVGEGVERSMTDEEMQARLKQQAEEIEELQHRTISQQVKEEIQEDLDALAETLAEKYNMAKKDVLEFIEARKEGLIKAWKTGKDAYEVAKQKIEAECQRVKNGAIDTYNSGVDKAEDAARDVAEVGKKFARGIHEGIKADVPEEPEEVDISQMSQEELLAYNDELLQRLKDETLGERVKREIKEKLDDIERTLKTKWNASVDKRHNRLSNIYHTVAGWVKGFFNAAKIDN